MTEGSQSLLYTCVKWNEIKLVNGNKSGKTKPSHLFTKVSFSLWFEVSTSLLLLKLLALTSNILEND